MENGKTVGYYENLALRVAKPNNVKIWIRETNKMFTVNELFVDNGVEPPTLPFGPKWVNRDALKNTENRYKRLLVRYFDCGMFGEIFGHTTIRAITGYRYFESLKSDSFQELEVKLVLLGV